MSPHAAGNQAHQDQHAAPAIPQGGLYFLHTLLATLTSSLLSEMYFLVLRALEEAGCTDSAQALAAELQQKGLLPGGVHWNGEHRNMSYTELVPDRTAD